MTSTLAHHAVPPLLSSSHAPPLPSPSPLSSAPPSDRIFEFVRHNRPPSRTTSTRSSAPNLCARPWQTRYKRQIPTSTPMAPFTAATAGGAVGNPVLCNFAAISCTLAYAPAIVLAACFLLALSFFPFLVAFLLSRVSRILPSWNQLSRLRLACPALAAWLRVAWLLADCPAGTCFRPPFICASSTLDLSCRPVGHCRHGWSSPDGAGARPGEGSRPPGDGRCMPDKC